MFIKTDGNADQILVGQMCCGWNTKLLQISFSSVQLIHYQVLGKSLAALHVISFFHTKFVRGHGLYHHQVHIFFEDIHNVYRDVPYHTAVILRLGSLLMRFSYLHIQMC